MPLIVEETVEPRFPCPDCSSILKSQSEMIAHLNESHDKVHNPTVKCLKCNVAANTEEELYDHLRREHHIDKRENAKKFIASDDDSVLRCYVCGALFPCKANLIRHINRYHNLDANPGGVIATTSDEACISTSIDVKPRIGDDGKASLESEQSGQDESTFPCPFNCVAKFDNRLDLQKHVRLGIHDKPTYDKPTNVNCRKCGLKFTLQNPCKCDNGKTTETGRFAFLCRSCRKAFFSKERLAVHLREAHGADNSTKIEVKDFVTEAEKSIEPLSRMQHKCQHCPSSYLMQQDLTRHLREKHGKMNGFYIHGNAEKVQKTKPSEETEYSSTERKMSKCPFCPKTFVSGKLRMQHVLFGTHHFRCEQCEEDFTNLSEKNEHELLRHGNSKTIVQPPSKRRRDNAGENHVPDPAGQDNIKIESDFDQ